MRHFGAVFRAIKIAPPPNQQLPASPVKSAFACILTATKNFGQLRKLSPIPGVLRRPIVSDPRKEYLSIFSRAIFSTPWYFRGRPNFAFLGRFEGGFRPGATSCSRFPVARNRPVCRVSVISGVTAILSRRPETYLRGDPTRVVVRRVKRFTPDACRAVAVARNALFRVEACRRGLTFPQFRAIV